MRLTTTDKTIRRLFKNQSDVIAIYKELIPRKYIAYWIEVKDMSSHSVDVYNELLYQLQDNAETNFEFHIIDYDMASCCYFPNLQNFVRLK